MITDTTTVTIGARVVIVRGDWKGFTGQILSVAGDVATVAVDDPPALFEGSVTIAVRIRSLIRKD